jgi:two-component system, response regulator PdtaR
MVFTALFVRKNDKHIKITVQDILYVCADGSYLTIVTSREQFSLSQNLSQFLRRNDIPSLVRVHRSYIVNVDTIDSFDHAHLYIGEHQIPISSSYRNKLMKSIHCI